MSNDDTRRAIATAGAPAALGPYSQALRHGPLLFCSGQIGLDPTTGKLVEGGFVAQAARVFDNLAAVLAADGMSFADVVKVTVYVTDLARFSELNEIYAARFAEPYPARATVEASALPLGAEVEIDVIASAARDEARG